jgi:outer membrane murein-binding lipoprotein Lpp
MAARGIGVSACVLLVALLGGCKREPTFDERYASAQKAVAAKAREIDKEMAQRSKDAHAAFPDATDTASEEARSGSI